MKPIVVVNPNSNPDVTAGPDEALAGFRFANGPAIECLTLAEGPFGIESAEDAARVVLPLADLMRGRPDAGAFVIACFSDPGLSLCRAVAPAPVFGIMESGILMALARADLFGVVAIREVSIPRHRQAMRQMGVLDRLAGERALEMSVADSAGEGAYARLAEVAAQLKADGAGTVVLGCAGMARHRARLEAEIGVTVIDPTQAAVAMALGAVLA